MRSPDSCDDSFHTPQGKETLYRIHLRQTLVDEAVQIVKKRVTPQSAVELFPICRCGHHYRKFTAIPFISCFMVFVREKLSISVIQSPSFGRRISRDIEDVNAACAALRPANRSSW
jgi:hypothetical protein